MTASKGTFTSEMEEKTVEVDAGYVEERLAEIRQDRDLSRYIL